MIEEQAKQPRAAGGPCDGGDGYAACNFVLAYECTQCGRREAANDSAKASLENRTAFDCSAWLALAARWLVSADEEDRLANCAMAAERMLSHSLHCGRADSLRACAEEVRRAAEANSELNERKSDNTHEH